MSAPTDRIAQAACRDHPILAEDAWSEVRKNYPRDEGAKALLVCRLACPVRAECKELFPQGVDAIAGGGWFNRRGDYREPKDDLYTSDMAAAFLGVTVERIQRLSSKQLPVVVKEKGRAWYHETDVWALAEKLSPPHGTTEALNLHHVRGERPCQRCLTEGSDASLL